MGFVVPTSQPAPPSYLNPPNVIRAETLDSIVQLDRYCFATRRNVIASLSRFDTIIAPPNLVYKFNSETSADSTGNVWCIASGFEIEVIVSTAYSSVTMSLTGGTIVGAQQLTGIPASTSVEISISIGSLIAPAVGTLRGLYLVEEILDAGSLP